jgi:hypothetical protein
LYYCCKYCMVSTHGGLLIATWSVIDNKEVQTAINSYGVL